MKFSAVKTVCLLIVVQAFLTHLEITAQDKDLIFERFYTSDGLPNNTVRAICQDSSGFLWIGTIDGLVRYDGYNFKIYRPDPKDSSSISHHSILSLYCDSAGILWIGSNGGGLIKYDRYTDSFKTFSQDSNNPDSISNNTIRCIIEDRERTLWIGTDGGGLNKMDRRTEKFINYKNDPGHRDSISHDRIWTVYEDRNGRIWVGTYGGGLNRFDKRNNSYYSYRHDPDDQFSISRDRVRSIYQDSRGSLWIGTDHGGVNRFDIEKEKFIRYGKKPEDVNGISNDRVRTILEDSKGNLWIGTVYGLNLYNRDTDSFIAIYNEPANAYAVSDNSIWSILEDRSGILWIGTIDGLNKMNWQKQEFTYFYNNMSDDRSIINNDVRAIHEDHSGDLLVGTDNGLDYYSAGKKEFTQFRDKKYIQAALGDKRIRSILYDSKGIYWVGTYRTGLYKFNLNSALIEKVGKNKSENSVFSGLRIQSIIESKDGIIWIGSYGRGVFKYIRESDEFKNYRFDENDQSSLSNDKIWSLYEDSRGIIWVGTVGGLNIFDAENEKFTRFVHDETNDSSISTNSIRAICEDNEGNIWIGTDGGGINRFLSESRSFENYTEENGLSNNSVYGIVKDKSGILWLSTNKGISKFYPEEKVFITFDSNDYLEFDQFNTGAHYINREGVIYFGGDRGLYKFDPDRIGQDSFKPPVVLTDLKIFNESAKPGSQAIDNSITYSKLIELKHDQNVFTLEYAALDFRFPKKIEYAYMMDGFEEEWNYAGSRRFSTYVKVPPGDYTFKIRSSNSVGIWSDDYTEVRVRVVPPFWMTPLFKVLMVLSVLTLGIIAYRTRLRSLSRQNTALEKLVEQKTSELQADQEELKQVNLKLKKEYDEKVKAEKTKYTLYKISESVTLSQDLYSLYDSIKEALSDIINTDNFYIALVDEIKDLAEFVYFSDDKDYDPYIYNVSRSGTLTARVLQSSKPIMLFKEDLEEIYNENRGILIGTKPLVWLGVPLKLQNKMIGVMAVQSYTNPDLYNEVDLSLLETVSRQVALSIEVKRMEDIEKKIQEKLQNTQKMESIGRLAGGVAHEFNNIMTGIMGYAELLKLRFKDRDTFEGEAADIIISSIDRASNLTKQLLGFARKGKFNPRNININEVIIENLKIMEKAFSTNVVVKTNFCENLPKIEGDTVQFEQVFMNLLINASDAMPNGGNILLKTEIVKINELNHLKFPELEIGDYVKITISDTGLGIPKNILNKIFDPFFSTKGMDKGTGLGLATVYGIVKNHQGMIQVESELGMGTNFYIFLPSVTNGNGEDSVEEKIDLIRAKGVVFVIDDEEHIRSFADKALKYIGFSVLSAEDSLEALSIYKENHSEIDVVLLDLIMPNVSGYEVFRKIRTINPDAQVILMSGYSEYEGASELIEEGALEFIQKPFKMIDLTNTISKYIKN